MFDDPSMENVRPENWPTAEGRLAARPLNSEPDPANNLQIASALPEPHETLPSVEEDVNMAGAIPGRDELSLPRTR
jgi:hypothetical protein